MSFSKIVKCETCMYYEDNNNLSYPTCKAYPTGIPTRIFSEEKSHDRHRPFDKGYRYEPKE
ncbi:MAG: hypothetical protein MJ089_00010 [Ruminococcus sp.]|nr:hypothetical protein [Ruminococcus sp.]